MINVKNLKFLSEIEAFKGLLIMKVIPSVFSLASLCRNVKAINANNDHYKFIRAV